MTGWDARWLALAEHIGGWSKDRSTKVGCVIVGSANQILTAGYNGFPRGIDDDIDERHERPVKYIWTEHAERNAIYNAARWGIRLEGAAMYTALFPCTFCARAIIQSGLSTVVSFEPDWDHHRWGDDHQISLTMLEEAMLTIRLILPS